ncbi:MAG TPA: hypothetical protein VGF48_25700 [Thermoanaerobaculia bacterium]|jgi:hypothetical protein
MKKQPHRIIWAFALGYCIAYAPYAGLVKALTSGRMPGFDPIRNGFELLPSVLAGTIVVLPLYALLLGWWRHAERPSRAVVVSGIGTAVIIATTTMAYTFHGVSILFALLLLRGGVLILAPVVDLVFHRSVRWFSYVALMISFSAVLLAIFASSDHRFTLAAGINTTLYLCGYLLRLPAMTAAAKIEDPSLTRRYFVGELTVALPLLAIIPIAGAAFGHDGLQRGLTLLASGSPSAGAGLVVGAIYASLYCFGTLIYLDRRENTFCISLNRGSSLLSGVVASFVVSGALGLASPAWFELTSVAMVVLAFAFLSPLHHIPEWLVGAAHARLVRRKSV